MITPTESLRDLLERHLPDQRGRWNILAEGLGLDRRTIHGWLRRGAVPARWLDALATLLALPVEVQAELRRMAGVRTLPTVVESEIAVQEGV